MIQRKQQPQMVKCRNCNTEYDRSKSDACPVEWCRSTSFTVQGGKVKKVKRMRTVSKKRAKLMRDNKDWRTGFIKEAKRCQVCFCRGDLAVHEIARGATRLLAFEHRACCLVACWQCNMYLLTDYSLWPIERQLAQKLLTDPHHFDLALFNKVRGRATTAVTLADLAEYLELRK